VGKYERLHKIHSNHTSSFDRGLHALLSPPRATCGVSAQYSPHITHAHLSTHSAPHRACLPLITRPRSSSKSRGACRRAGRLGLPRDAANGLGAQGRRAVRGLSACTGLLEGGDAVAVSAWACLGFVGDGGIRQASDDRQAFDVPTPSFGASVCACLILFNFRFKSKFKVPIKSQLRTPQRPALVN
jgi:hypothetical protein